MFHKILFSYLLASSMTGFYDNSISTTGSVGKFEANMSCLSLTTYLFFHLREWEQSALQLEPVLCYQDSPEIILIVSRNKTKLQPEGFPEDTSFNT